MWPKEDYDNCVSYDHEPYEGPLAVQVPSEEATVCTSHRAARSWPSPLETPARL
mgnify:CR=1 FL=1